MRKSTEQMINKVQSILQSAEDYVTSKQLASKTGLSRSSIFNIIARLNAIGVGVQTRHKMGYVLSEYASRQDDVHIMRRMNSQYARNVMRIQAFMPHMDKRWKSKDDQNLFSDMTRPLITSNTALDKSRTALQTCIKRLFN